jgi:DNA-binding transcriptional regulator YhcF (GntR family)
MRALRGRGDFTPIQRFARHSRIPTPSAAGSREAWAQPLTICILSSIQIDVETDATLTLDWTAAEPVYEQIARQIRTRIAAGELPPGAALPAVRTLASDLGVNLNTVARAYRLLDEQGFVVIRDRAGAVVAAPAAAPDPASLERLRHELSQVLLRLRQAGVAPEEIHTMVESVVAGSDRWLR